MYTEFDYFSFIDRVEILHRHNGIFKSHVRDKSNYGVWYRKYSIVVSHF